jgi:CheY-like chemotaxis protein
MEATMKVLIIDDQEWRKPYYKNLSEITGFDVELVFLDESSANTIEKFLNDDFDAILLDVVLDGEWQISSSHIARRIREIDKGISIILVTGNWTATNYSQIEDISRQFDTHLVPLPFTDLLTKKQFNSLTEDKIDKRDCKGIKDTNIAYFARTLQAIISARSNQIYLSKDKNDSLYILHLSDMQMGGNQEKGSLLEPSTIAQYVKGLYGCPDFITITGDIAEQGLPEEFDLAYKWIKEICDEFDWQHPFDRVMLIPGNHDVYAPAFGICKTEYRCSSEKEGEKSGFVTNDNVNDNDNMLASDYSLKNFRDFAYKLTKNSYWIDNPDSDWVDDQFVESGLCFFGLNTVVNNCYNAPFSGLPATDHYQKYRASFRAANKCPETLIIALAHHPSIAEDTCYNTFSQTKPSPSILLAGHLHKPDFEELRSLNQLMFTAPTSSLKAELRWADVNRGFSVIELKRSNRKVIGLKQYSHLRVNGKWILDPDHYDYKRTKDQKWKVV